jgi:hypothetical protein
MNTTTNTTAQEINTNKVCLYFLTAVAIVSTIVCILTKATA